MDCSLSGFYGRLWIAIGLLGVAIAGALVPLNVLGLSAAVGAVATVAFLIIPQMRDELRAYDACMGGPSEKCSVKTNIDLLGQIVSFLSLVAFATALLLEFTAIAAFASIILAPLGVAPAAAAAVLRQTGAANCALSAVLLLILFTEVRRYERCRERETRLTPPPGAGDLPLN